MNTLTLNGVEHQIGNEVALDSFEGFNELHSDYPVESGMIDISVVKLAGVLNGELIYAITPKIAPGPGGWVVPPLFIIKHDSN